MPTESISVSRDYKDNFSVKQFAVEEVMPKYFPEEDTSNLTLGLEGMLTEYISTIAEDAFNTGSSLVAEAFPTRARMESSIYANAAIFQLSDTFATAGRCDFLLVIPEEDIQKNFVTKTGSTYYYFYIGKDTRVLLENIPFLLDYDIEIRAMYRETQGKWLYSAKYLIEDYKNSVSTVTDPYVKLRQTANGLVALQVTMRQYTRTIEYESITDNATLNYPTISVSFSGTLAGFDVLYKGPNDTDYNTQLTPKIMYSIPSKEPFCYYKMTGDNSLELSFTTKDSYFQPAFNSELEIIIYTTMGTEGEFEEYTGTIMSITKDENYEYPNSWMLTARPMSGCVGAQDKLTTEGLRQLTVEGFSTANSLNTEHDLQLYFNNYKYRYNNEVLFLKKRNDAVELLFSAFMFIKKDDYIYPTNTLTLDSNIQYLDYKDGGFYNLDPGYLFGYKGEDAYYIPVFFIVTGGNGEKYDTEGKYYDSTGVRDNTKDITLAELNRRVMSGAVVETDHSYYKLATAASDVYQLFLSNGTIDTSAPTLSSQELFTKFAAGELTYGLDYGETKNIDFILNTTADAEARVAYVNYYEVYKVLQGNAAMTFDEYLFAYPFKKYKADNGIDNRRTVFDEDIENFPERQAFMFTNPFIITIAKDVGLVSYYQSFIAQDSSLDFVNENDDDAFVQFVTYTLHVQRDISTEKRYLISLTVLPSVSDDTNGNVYVPIRYDEENTDLFILRDGVSPELGNFDKSALAQNNLRILMMFTDEGLELGYLELIPISYDSLTEQIVFEAVISTDDYITTTNKIRHTHICPYCGHEVLNSANATTEGNQYYCDSCGKLFEEGIINIRESDSILLPILDMTVQIYALYKDPENTAGTTNNIFAKYDSSFEGYIWTNQYCTQTDPLTLIQPLDMMRSTITYKDYYLSGVDALDCTVSDIPLLKYSILAYKDQGMEVTDPLLSDDIGKFQFFMNEFLHSYDILLEAKQFLNGMNIDMKFYNTYGRSTNFDIGDDNEPIDTNNISIYFDIWLSPGTDPYESERELKTFIKSYVETINGEGSNDLYISNLMREIEVNFAYVHHIRFRGINDYDSSYQAIINRKISLESLTKEERRRFVPDLLVLNLNNIYLSFFTYE